MKSVKDALKPVLLDLLREGREAAATPFKPETLRETLQVMARKGVAEFRVRPTLALDVRSTATAAKGMAFLEGEGIACEWQAVAALPDAPDNPGGLPGEYFELVVRLKP